MGGLPSYKIVLPATGTVGPEWLFVVIWLSKCLPLALKNKKFDVQSLDNNFCQNWAKL